MSVLLDFCLAMFGGVLGYFVMRSAEREGYKHGYQDGVHDRKVLTKAKRKEKQKSEYAEN